ncbi:hypothetical protein N9Y81_04345 [Akkermansiaceae bacterium]|nr:hypothetical protein [Akkermansiaceae bacterium]
MSKSSEKYKYLGDKTEMPLDDFAARIKNEFSAAPNIVWTSDNLNPSIEFAQYLGTDNQRGQIMLSIVPNEVEKTISVAFMLIEHGHN